MATEIGVVYSDWSLPWVMPSGNSSSYRLRLHYDLKEETNTTITYIIRGFVDLTRAYNTKFTGVLRFGDSQVTGTSPVVYDLYEPIFYYTKTFTKSENETTVLLYAEASPEYGGWEQKTVKVSADIPIPAKWYTITFNANGGSNPPASQNKIHGTNLTLTTETPTRAGYDFVSWNTAADGSGTSYASGAAFSTNADTTLYAQWHISYVPPKVENIRAYRVANGKSGYNPDVLSSGTKTYAEFKLTNPVSGTVTVSAKFGTTAPASSGTNGSIKYFYSPDSHLSVTSSETVTFTLSATDYKNNKYTYTYTTFVSKEIYIFDAFKGSSGSTEYQSFALGGNARDFSSSSRSSKGDFDCYMDASFKGSMNIATPLPIASGGTGASTVAAARNNLGLGNTSGALPIANGGTGATTVAAALKNLELDKIGGRNLFLNTGEAVSNNNYKISEYAPANGPLKAGETYTATICVTPAKNLTEIGVFFSLGYIRPVRFYPKGTGKQVISGTFTMAYYDGRTPDVNPSYAYTQLYRYPNDGTVTGNTTVHWFKIEKGFVATDWTPAPEDKTYFTMAGEIKMLAGNKIPDGWLLCDGSEVSKTKYPKLYAAIGDLWGTPNSSSNFKLPNLTGRVPVGYNSADTDTTETFGQVGATGGARGAWYHTHTIGSSGAHSHASQGRMEGSGTGANIFESYNGASKTRSVNVPRSGTNGNHTHSPGSSGSAGNKLAADKANMPPYAVVKYIICAF